ncbi:MAG: stage III sporulation protein AG [Peptococcaceae bacterium]|nr:stage III sporulation protein AG [Peptococcaceae bacterium]
MNFFKEGFTEKIMLSVILLIVVAGIFIFTAKDNSAKLSLKSEANPVSAVPADNSGISSLEKNLEEKIAASLESIKGVGKVKVLVTYSSGLRKEYARNESITKRSSKETDKEGGTRETVEDTRTDSLVLSGNTNPLVVVEQKPQVEGVLIIAQGASDPKIKEQIFEAVKTLLNIQPAKISVAPMGGV